MAKLEKILVPVDFSSCSRAALDYALLVAQRFRAPLEVLHVIRQPPSYPGAEVMVDVSGQSRVSLAKFARQQAEKELETFVASVSIPDGVQLSTRLSMGDPIRMILEVAATSAVDLIIMGTNGRTVLRAFVVGRVAEKVVRRAPCPVLTVRDPAKRPLPEEDSVPR